VHPLTTTGTFRLGKPYQQQQLADHHQQELKALVLCCRAMGTLKKTMSSTDGFQNWNMS
jgi:hypothetical protein